MRESEICVGKHTRPYKGSIYSRFHIHLITYTCQVLEAGKLHKLLSNQLDNNTLCMPYNGLDWRGRAKRISDPSSLNII